MYSISKDLDTDNDTPEVSREETDIEESSGSETEKKRGERVEYKQTEGIPSQVTAHISVPGSRLERGAVEDGGLDANDAHAPEANLAEDFVHRSLADKVFFRDVGQTVESSAKEGEEVALELVAARNVGAAAGTGNVVGGQEDTHTAYADENSNDLGPMVADAEEDEWDNDNHDDGPEVDELGA